MIPSLSICFFLFPKSFPPSSSLSAVAFVCCTSESPILSPGEISSLPFHLFVVGAGIILLRVHLDYVKQHTYTELLLFTFTQHCDIEVLAGSINTIFFAYMWGTGM